MSLAPSTEYGPTATRSHSRVWLAVATRPISLRRPRAMAAMKKDCQRVTSLKRACADLDDEDAGCRAPAVPLANLTDLTPEYVPTHALPVVQIDRCVPDPGSRRPGG